MRLLTCIALCAGCSASYMPTCDWEVDEVGDDVEVWAGMSADLLLAEVADPEPADGVVGHTEDPVEVSWSIERGVGTARFYDGTRGTHRTGPPFALSKTYPLIYVPCTDNLVVPAIARVSVPDLGVDVEVSSDFEAYVDDTWQLVAQLPVDAPGVVLPEGPWDDGSDAEVEVRIRMGDNAPDHLSSWVAVQWEPGGNVGQREVLARW